MSAFLSIAYADRVELMVDGACCLPTGEFLAAVDKIMASPHVPMAITGRGGHTDLRQLEETLVRVSSCGSVDTTLEMLAESLAAISQDANNTPRHFEVVIAAVSETLGPRNFYFCSFTREESPWGPIPAFTLWDWADCPIGGGPEPTPEQFEEAGINAESFRDGLLEQGLRLMELLRSMPGKDPTNPDGHVAHWIGGHVDHAVVSAAGVTVTRVRQWPDAPLRPIQPEAVAA